MRRCFTALAIFFVFMLSAGAVRAETLKIGSLPAADSVILHVAADEGLFAARGLEVEIVPFQSALELGAAMRAGELAGHFGDLLNVLMQNERGARQAVIATTTHSSPEQRCFALAETRIYYVVAWNKLYRRSLFQHLRYAPGKRYEDQFLLPHLLAQCKTIACLAAPGYRYVQRSGSIMAQGSSRTYLDRPEYLLDWCAYFTQKGDALRAEGLLNDAIQNLAEKQCFDLSTPAQQARYRAACRACADSYTALAAATGQRSMRLRAALLRIGLPAYQAFLKHKT